MTRQYINGIIARDTLELYYRDDTGELMYDEFPAEQSAFFKSNEITASMRRDPRVERWVDESGGWVRCVFKAGYYDKTAPNKWNGGLGMWIPYRELACKEWGVQSYEGDVSPLRRLMSDKGFQVAKPRRAYFDIETDSRCTIEEALAGQARILCWTMCNEDRTEKYIGVLNVDTDADEERLLNEFWVAASRYDQLAGWNSDDFDKPVIRERTKLRGLQWIRRLLWIDHMQAYKRHNISNAESGEEKQSFALDNVATNVLGFGKHDFDASKTWEAWAADGEERARMVKYCMQDTELMPQIEAETGYLDITQSVAELCGIFPDSRALKPTAQVDGYMLRLGIEQAIHFKTKWYEGEQLHHVAFPGAFVMEPQVHGITHNVMCGDFSSMYPSIIITWNLSPDAKDPQGQCVSPSNGVRTSEVRDGIMSYALRGLLAKRKELKAAGNKRGEKAVKIVANSFYGVLGNKYSRFYDIELCEATTQNGVWLIKTTITEAEKRGYKVIYSDTDSIMVTGPSEEEFREFLTWCNTKLYPELTSKQGVRECLMSIAYDKGFDHIVFTAAKRYVAKQMGKEKPVIKGVEYNRGDINKLGRMLQKQVIDLIVAGEQDVGVYEKLVSQTREKVATEPLSREFVTVSKSIEDLDDYDSNPPQLRVAEILKSRGQDVRPGTRISYVVIDGYSSPKKVIPAEDYTGEEVDRDALWNHGIYPATKRLLDAAFPYGPWARWLRKGKPKIRHNPKQLGLFK